MTLIAGIARESPEAEQLLQSKAKFDECMTFYSTKAHSLEKDSQQSVEVCSQASLRLAGQIASSENSLCEDLIAQIAPQVAAAEHNL